MGNVDIVATARSPLLVQLQGCHLYPLSTYRACEYRCTYCLAEAGLRVQCNIAPWIPGASDIEAIMAELPSAVRILVAPPILGKHGMRPIANRRLHREPVVSAYMNEYRRLGHLESVDFLAPIPPPLENFAFHLRRRSLPNQ